MRILMTATLTLMLAAAGTASQHSEMKSESGEARLADLSVDLRALERIVSLSKDLGENRQVINAILDTDIESLREPRGDGTYRWASLAREEDGRVREEKGIETVESEKLPATIAVTAPRAYRLLVSVPQKRNLVSANNRVFVRKATVEITGFDGKTKTTELPIDAWINPGDSHGVALPEIAKSARATVEVGVESGGKKAVAEVALLQARLVDDAQSPFFPAVRRLVQMKAKASQKDIDRGELKSLIDEGVLALPGEMRKRQQELSAAAEERKKMLQSGSLKGLITLGDASSDVVRELSMIETMLAGTADEQMEGRKRLQTLSLTLSPPTAKKD